MTLTEERDETREIASTRVFDAPRELVFRMWTEEEHIKQWWGPRGFTTTTQHMDVRPGGTWEFVMHGPDGTDYPNHITYREVVAPERLTYSHGPEPQFGVTVTFEEEGPNRTRVSMRMFFASAEVRRQVVEEFGAIEGQKQTLDRLEERLAVQTAREFVISRTFDAPRELVFRTWTETEHFSKWFGPRGATILRATNDLRVGGMMHYGMRAADGMEMWGRWVYREITPPERLVFISSFSDPEGTLQRAPFPGDWALETLSTITFEEAANGGTTVTVRWVPFHATETERAFFEQNHPSFRGGWTGTFDQYAEYLEKVVRA